MDEKGKTEIIILAGGVGKRMQSELPKVLVPLNGKPLVSHVLDAVEKSDICQNPLIIVGQKRELVMQTLGDKYRYVIQEEQLGTGHAVAVAQNAIDKNIKNIIVLYGDHPFIKGGTIKKLLEKHLSSGVEITMATVKLPDFEDWRSVFYKNFSRIIRDSDGKILKDVQYKDATEEEREVLEVNPCYFCFEAKWLFENLKKLNTNNAQKEYYLTDLIKIAMEQKIKIESINIDPREALGVNSKNELEILENLAI